MQHIVGSFAESFHFKQTFFCTKWKLNKWKATNKLLVADNPTLILLGYYFSVATTGFLMDNMILLESLDLHSGSNMNSIPTDIIDLYTNFNNSTNDKL